MWDAPYGIMKVYLSVRLFFTIFAILVFAHSDFAVAGYGNAEELISYDTYCNKERPTRASVVCAIARMFTRFMEVCSISLEVDVAKLTAM